MKTITVKGFERTTFQKVVVELDRNNIIKQS